MLEEAKKNVYLSDKSDDTFEPDYEQDCKSQEEPDYSNSIEMPKYRSHKEVWALKIKSIVLDSDLAKETNRKTDGSAIITPEEDGYAPFKVDFAYVRKHNPVAGGYYVVYKGGYKSFSPGDVFEEGNIPISKLPLHVSNPFEWMKGWINAYHRENGGVSGDEMINWMNDQPMTCG